MLVIKVVWLHGVCNIIPIAHNLPYTVIIVSCYINYITSTSYLSTNFVCLYSIYLQFQLQITIRIIMCVHECQVVGMTTTLLINSYYMHFFTRKDSTHNAVFLLLHFNQRVLTSLPLSIVILWWSRSSTLTHTILVSSPGPFPAFHKEHACNIEKLGMDEANNTLCFEFVSFVAFEML